MHSSSRYQGRHAAPRRSRLKPALAAMVVAAGAAGIAAPGLTGAPDSVPVVQSAPVTLQRATTAAVAAVGDDVHTMMRARERGLRLSRSASRSRDIVLIPAPSGAKFATAPLNLWTEPREQGTKITVLARATKVAVTGRVVGHWAEVVTATDRVRWVNADYLSRTKPKPLRAASSTATSSSSHSSSASTSAPSTTTTSGISGAPCPDGSSIEYGLTSSAVRLYRAVCAAFPQPTTYGGLDGHGEHVDGRALDIMISGETGWQIAEWLRANAGTLGVRDIIYSQRIWTPEQASSGWRYMSDRGSATANHYDHVHVAVF